MSPLQILVIVLIIGSVFLFIAGLLDRRSRNLASEKQLAVPKRHIPDLAEDVVPSYLPEDEILAKDVQYETLTDKQSADLLADMKDGLTLDLGFSDERFITHINPKRVIIDEPLVILVDGQISSIRELLPIIKPVGQQDCGLVLICLVIDKETENTLLANRIELGHRIVVLTASERQLAQIGAYLECATVSQTDLQAGYIPSQAQGRCVRWISGAKSSTIV